MSATRVGAGGAGDGNLDRDGRATRARALILRSAAAFAVLALAVPLLNAQTVPTGYQEYFVIGRDQHIWDMMDKVQDGEGGAQFVDGMNSIVTATASADNQVFFYDHWEDGLEADILNPVQGSTLVIGDGNPANGDACDFNNSACGVDVLAQGDFVNFASDQGLGAGCTLPSAQPGTYTELCSSVPMNDRCAVAGACTSAEVHFDGGDYIYTSGGPASIVHSQYPLTQFIGGSTEMLSRQAVEAARSYSVPVGEDLYPAFGCPNCVMEPFHYVDLNLVAFEDNTQVVVTSPGAGTVTFTLDRGQHWSSLGFVDDTTAAPSLTINAGTKVSTTAPINGMIFTGGDGTWATRHYALLPDLLHSTDYVITAPGDDPNAGPTGGGTPQNRPANIYILNPDPLNTITVTTTDSVGSCDIDIPPNSVVDYFTGTGTGTCTAGGARFVPNGSTVRLTSNRNFWGISAYDYNTNISDWGHSWLATKFLSRNYTISYAPASVPPPTANLNPVYVAATQDNTRVQFDLDNDGVFDAVDLTGNGVADPAPLPNNTYLVSALGALRAFDPNPLDRDNTGTRIVSNKPVAVAWGQDTDLTQYGDVALDTGYTAYPTNQLFLDPVLVIDKEVDRTTVLTAGGVATYTLTVTSYDFGPLTNLRVFDLLDPAVPGGSYVPNSTLVTYPNLVQDTTDPTITDDGDPTTRDQLEWTISPDTIGTNQTLTIRYSVDIPPAPGGTPRLLTNEGHAEARLGGSTFSPFDTADLVQTDIGLTKSVDDVSPGAGDVLTFTLNVVNGGAVAETGVSISDALPANTTFVTGSITTQPGAPFTGVYDAAQNAVVWTAANFPGGGPWALTFQAQVNPGVPAGTSIENRGGYESTQTPYFLSNEVTPVVTGPLLQATKSGPAGPLHPGQTATFEILVENLGAAQATGVRIVDPFPSSATYVPGSMEWRLNTGSFAPVTDAALDDEGTLYADRLELVVGTLGAGEDLVFRFSVVVDAGTAWQAVNNQATVTSNELIPFDTNLVSIPILGSAAITGHVFLDLDGDGTLDPGEPGIPNVDVVVTDATGVSQVVTTDSNGDYACTVDVGCYRDIFTTVAYDGSDGTRDWSASSWTEFRGDGAPDQDPTAGSLYVAPDPANVNGYSLTIAGGGQTPKGFDRTAALGGATTATFSFDYSWEDFEAGDQVTVSVSYNGGAFVPLATYGAAGDAAWQSASFTLSPGFAMNNVVVRFGTTGGFGTTDFFYIDNVVLCPSADATANVDETDPDFPVGVTLTTANDPQVIVAVSGTTVPATPVGYVPPPITVDKRSSATGSNVAPGETITYTIEMTNNTAVTQTGIDVTDPLPTGTSYVSGSAQASSPVFRVTEYDLSPGTFTGLTYDLTLGQDLANDYFVIVQGSDGDGTGTGGGRDPDENYARLTAVPLGRGDLPASGANDRITLGRGGSVAGTSWVGVVTVVECVADCDVAGFRLRSVEEVLHGGALLSGTDTSATAWTTLGQVQLVGGFNGAGCSTGDTDIEDQKVCHARIYPSGTNTINWTRDDVGAVSMSDATSTVMVVEWGSEWTVQRARVQGTNGGDGLNAAGEYNTAALGAPVVRDNTWVWGTGHTNDQGIGDSGEGVALTLGNGVAQNASESTVAAGSEDSGTAVDFEVYALTHADLATDYRFKVDGDTGALTVNVPVDAAAAGQRMALVTNGQNGTGNAYPRPMFSARYTSDTQVELRRRRSGQDFPAWVQGIDFSAIAGTVLLPDPPNLINDTDGYTLAPGETLTVTLQVQVDDPLDSVITDIVNTATVVTDQEGPFVDQTVDPVVRPAVSVEYNNADFTTADPIADTTVTYTHEVVNTGDVADSYRLTLTSEQGWTVDLIDPDTGGIIARDTNGDGVWDGGITINTGTLAPGDRVEYQVRVTVPAGTPVATQDHTRLEAVSNRSALVSDTAEDETTVLGPTDFGPVAIIPDNSGVVAAGEWTAYTHRVINRTGAPDTFDLYADSSQGWTATIYHDSNGDGVYSPGIDVAINNTLLLANDATQLVFVVVDAPAGTLEGTVDVTHLTAVSGNDDTLFDGATDTTTVVVTGLDLSGGGTRIVDPGDTGIFAGTLVNLGSGDDTYALDITWSSLSGIDGLNHPTQLAIDTDADGVPDLVIAEDADGDGTWDTIEPGYDPNTDGEPDVTVPGGGTLAYELRRTVDPAQTFHREHVSLTITSSSSGRTDSITATNLLAAVTRAGIRGVRVDPEGEVAFVTTTQVGTASFMVFETNDPRGAKGRQALHDAPQRSPVPDSLTPILYRVSTRPVTKRFVMIKETETDGDVLWKGPFRVGDRRMRRSFEDVERLMARAGIPHDRVQRTRGMRPLVLAADQARRRVLKSHRRPTVPSRARGGNASSRPRGGGGGGGARRYATSGVKIEVHEAGRVEVPVTDLEAAGLVGLRPGIPVYLSSRGRRVPFQWVAASDRSWSLAFPAERLSTDYSGTNAYVVTVGAPPPGGSVALTDTSKPDTPGFTRVEKNVLYVPSLPEGPDPWQWDVLFSGWPWPDPSWDPAAGDFDLPDLLPGASGEIPLRIQVVGYTEHRHSLTATINGLPVGSLDFDGRVEATLEGTVPAETLLASGNTLSITYVGTDLPSSPGSDAMAYIDFLDLAIPGGPGSRTAVFELTPYLSDLPSLRDVEYLIVTHPLFRAQADRVAVLKADDGLKAVVVETDTAYDRFSGGIVEPRAIQALVRKASRVSAALRYVLLIGDDTFDPRDFVGIGSRSFVPSLFGRDATWGRVPSETRYSDVDGDGRPDLRFGRLPVQSIAEAEALVEKIATQAEGLQLHQGAQLVVVDNSSETDAPFRAVAEEALALLPPSTSVRWAQVDQGPDAARVALFEGWQTGALLTHYFGHAGLTEWADELILTHEDIEAHGSTWKPTVLLTWACLSQWHIGIFGTAINEALLLQPGGGPVASFGPTGITSPARQTILIDALYRELAQPGISLGEAIRRAKRTTFERDPKASETVEGFLLLGDPALTLPWPEAVPQ